MLGRGCAYACGGVSSPFLLFFSPPVLFRALFVTALLFLLLFFNSSEHACRRACARMGSRTHGHAGPGAQLGQEAGREGEDRAPSSASPRCRVSARGGGGRRAPGPGRRSALFGAAEPPCPAAAHPALLQPGRALRGCPVAARLPGILQLPAPGSRQTWEGAVPST